MGSDRLSRRFAAGIMFVVVAAASVVAAPQAANAATTMKGKITCGANSQGRVVGMWVSTNAGGNGWASWSATADQMIADYSRSVPSGATTISVAVGCGGSTASWARTYYGSVSTGTGSGTLTKDWICYTYFADICV